jgi:prolyl oligopeptidase
MLAFAAAAAWAQEAPAKFPAKDVPETFFGVTVHDPYRALEDVKDPAVAQWMKAQSDHARATLDAIPGYGALRSRIQELDDAVEARVGEVRRMADGRIFFTRRGAKENTFKLFVRDARGGETLLVDPDDWQKQTGKPHAINYFAPSYDSRYVAFGISQAGSEAASIYVLEVATGKRIGTPIDRAQYPSIHWNLDNASFFYRREQKLDPGMPSTEKYQNSRAWLHRVGDDPARDVLLLGPGVTPRIEVPRADFPAIIVVPGSRYALAGVFAGVQREITLYSAPLESLGKPDTPWVKICDKSDKVTDVAVHGDDIYLLTYRDSPRFSIVRTALAAPDVAHAPTVVPASEQVLAGLGGARDALYIEARDGAVKRLKRMDWSGKGVADIRLPVEGAAAILSALPTVDGAVIGLAAWTRAREIYAVDAAGAVTNTKLQPLGKFDAPTDLVATEVKVKSHDGAMVPLSIIHRKGVKLDGTNPTLLYGYGSYGITEEPSFIPTRLAWLERGGVFAVANVRGTSVYGQDWYKAGYKDTKPNTWKDFIACAEYLVAQKYTSQQHLGIVGGSAGGILVGRSMTERPDLFAAVVSLVGALDMVRMETTANGIPNIPEFGTRANEEGFRALYAMSSYHHVKPGTAYPALLLVHGVNDPRVNVWQSLKMAAAVQAATTSGKPVLLDLDYESGHGIGDTKSQRQRQAADYYAFLLWQTGGRLAPGS